MNNSSDALLKQCAGECKQFLPATPDFFHRNKNHKDGLQTLCKICMKAYKKQHYQTHKDEVSEKGKAYRETHKEQVAERARRYQQETHREQHLEYHKQYYKIHKVQMLDQMKQRYKIHSDVICARVGRYGKTHKEQIQVYSRQYRHSKRGRLIGKVHSHRRRARKKTAEGRHTLQQLQEQIQRQKSKCYYCKMKLSNGWHPDHVVPLSRGGSNDIHNIVIACPTCNMRKHDRLPHEWPEGNRLL